MTSKVLNVSDLFSDNTSFGRKTDVIINSIVCFVPIHAAARVTVLSKQTVNNTRTYTVNVVKQYTLKSEKNGALSLAPSMAHQVVLQANPECCVSCPTLEINQEYMIAGHFVNSPSLKWLLRSHDSLVGAWKAKYGKKMEKWIERGNTYRLGQLQNGVGQ